MSNTDMGDDEKFLAYGVALVNAVDVAIRPWLREVGSRLLPSLPDDIASRIDEVAIEVKRSLTELATADVDEPLSGPLERIRRGVAGLTPPLEAAGAVHASRDPFDVQMRPDDVYALGPMAFSDLGEGVHLAGISWGAAKAHLHMQRRAGTDAARPDESA